MKFMKGVMLGTMLTAGAVMMYSDSFENGRKKIVRKGKQIIKKMGF